MEFCAIIKQFIMLSLTDSSCRYAIETSVEGELSNVMGGQTRSRQVYVTNEDNGHYVMLQQFDGNPLISASDMTTCLREAGYFGGVVDTASKESYRSFEEALTVGGVDLKNHHTWKVFYGMNVDKEHLILSYSAHRDEYGAIVVIKDEGGALVLIRFVECY